MSTPIAEDVIERMLDASAKVDGDDWRGYCSDDQRNFRKGMLVAARVLLDAICDKATDDESNHAAYQLRQGEVIDQVLTDFIGRRRGRIERTE